MEASPTRNKTKSKPVKVTSIQPVQVEVISQTPQISGDIEANNTNELPHAQEVRTPSRSTISTLVGYAIPVVHGRVQPQSQNPNANFHLSEREKILMEGYAIARMIRSVSLLPSPPFSYSFFVVYLLSLRLVLSYYLVS